MKITKSTYKRVVLILLHPDGSTTLDVWTLMEMVGTEHSLPLTKDVIVKISMAVKR